MIFFKKIKMIMKLDINDRAAIAIKNNTKRVKRNIISFFLYVIYLNNNLKKTSFFSIPCQN